MKSQWLQKSLKDLFVDASFDRAEMSSPKTYGRAERTHELHLYNQKRTVIFAPVVSLFPHSAKKHLFSDTGTSIC